MLVNKQLIKLRKPQKVEYYIYVLTQSQVPINMSKELATNAEESEWNF